jgi:hypothetical protein
VLCYVVDQMKGEKQSGHIEGEIQSGQMIGEKQSGQA